MIVAYDCKGCGMMNMSSWVPDQLPNQRFQEWVKTVVEPVVDIHHSSVAPDCASHVFSEIRIPHNGNQ